MSYAELGARSRLSRAGRKHISQKNPAFLNFENNTAMFATDAVFETNTISNPRIVQVNEQDVAMVDIEWTSTTKCLNYLSGNQASIRSQMSPSDQQQFDQIMKNDTIRNSFEATRNKEDEES